jgi:GDSL-like lipase/acylhydrolase family protein
MKQRRWGLARGFAVAVTAIAGIAVLFGIGEVAVRVFTPQEHLPPDLFVTDATLGYRVARNYQGEYVTRHFSVPLQTNSLGLRDHEYGPPAEGGIRIYFLGDSFVFGNRVPLENTVTKVLERVLRDRLRPRDVEVVNGGMPGYSTIQELKFFDETVDVVQPDVVLLGMCVGNDIWDNLLYSTRNTSDGGGGAWRAGGGGLRAKLTLLLKRSDLYLLIRRTFNQNFRGAEVEDTHADRPTQMVGPALQLTENAIKGFADAAQRRGIGFAVLLITVPSRVIPLETQQDLNAQFKSFAAEAGIRVYDLAPLFGDHHETDLYYTVHWTPHGHEVVAGATADFLLDSGLLGLPTAAVVKKN